MTFCRKYVVPAVLRLAILVLAARAAWVASDLETGWTSLRVQWRDATLGWFLGEYELVSEREPTDQADFWLRETDRIVAANPQSAEIAMGAALVLDTPGVDFTSRYMKIVRSGPGMTYPEFDQEAIDRVYGQFHAATDRRCLALAARATQLDPENSRWCRLRALLQFRNDFMGSDCAARDSAWSSVLDECSRLDPDNAIYDYLAALHLWDNSAEIDWKYDPARLEIDDPNRFLQGVACFERGLKKRCFTVDQDMEIPPVMTMLAHSRLPCTEDHKIVKSRTIFLRKQVLVRDVSRWQRARADALARSDDPAGALALLRQAVQLADQYAASNKLAAIHFSPSAVRVATYEALRDFVEKHPSLLSDAEREQIKSPRLASRADYKVLGDATQTVAAQQTGPQPPSRIVTLTAWGVAAPAVVLLLVVSGLARFAAHWMGQRNRQEHPRLDPWRHTSAWVVGFALTFVVLGLAPAEVISHGAQAWIGGTAGALAAIGLIAWLLWLARRRRLQFRLRTLFLVTFVAAMFCSALAVREIDFSRLNEVPERLHVPARGYEFMDAETWKQLITTQLGIGTWVLMQWWVYSGIYVSLTVSLLLVLVWQRLRDAKAGSPDAEGRLPWKARWQAAVHSTSNSAAAMAAYLLLVHLTLTPTALRSIDAAHQEQMAYARAPDAYWESIRQEVDQIKADSEYMAGLRAEVELELVREAEIDAGIEEELENLRPAL